MKMNWRRLPGFPGPTWIRYALVDEHGQPIAIMHRAYTGSLRLDDWAPNFTECAPEDLRDSRPAEPEIEEELTREYQRIGYGWYRN